MVLPESPPRDSAAASVRSGTVSDHGAIGAKQNTSGTQHARHAASLRTALAGRRWYGQALKRIAAYASVRLVTEASSAKIAMPLRGPFARPGVVARFVMLHYTAMAVDM